MASRAAASLLGPCPGGSHPPGPPWIRAARAPAQTQRTRRVPRCAILQVPVLPESGCFPDVAPTFFAPFLPRRKFPKRSNDPHLDRICALSKAVGSQKQVRGSVCACGGIAATQRPAPCSSERHGSAGPDAGFHSLSISSTGIDVIPASGPRVHQHWAFQTRFLLYNQYKFIMKTIHK